ncbi:MAG: DUF3467 domain-containing protein [Bacteroidota bacterium]
MSEQPEQKPQQPQLQIQIDDETAEGVYANLAMIVHGPDEFVLDFIRVLPGTPKARVRSRILITPQHARRLLLALEDNIRKYENSFGPIEERAPQPTIAFPVPSGEA